MKALRTVALRGRDIRIHTSNLQDSGRAASCIKSQIQKGGGGNYAELLWKPYDTGSTWNLIFKSTIKIQKRNYEDFKGYERY